MSVHAYKFQYFRWCILSPTKCLERVLKNNKNVLRHTLLCMSCVMSKSLDLQFFRHLHCPSMIPPRPLASPVPQVRKDWRPFPLSALEVCAATCNSAQSPSTAGFSSSVSPSLLCEDFLLPPFLLASVNPVCAQHFLLSFLKFTFYYYNCKPGIGTTGNGKIIVFLSAIWGCHKVLNCNEKDKTHQIAS